MNIAKSIELLLKYAENRGLVAGLDIVLARNLLMDMLGVPQPYEKEVAEDAYELEPILADILQYAFDNGLIEADTEVQRDLFEGKVMGLLTPRQSEVIAEFHSRAKKQGIKAATDYFYKLSRDTNYIKTDRIKKNLHWKHATDFGELEITINLSKPEKDPRDIAKAIALQDTAYPKCLLCVENVGFAGHINHPARQNHRLIPIQLGGEDWYFQYSPYSYYNEHCIPLCAQHRPMAVNAAAFERLLDFLELFPHYFVGSNAGLPIVGGSMLNHDHFQGGRHTFPIEKASVLAEYTLMGVKAEIVKWPMSVIRLKSADRKKIIKAAEFIFECWRGYKDEAAEIIPYTGNTPHNAITPIARINASGEYEFDLVLRNNRTSEEFPDGIFHPHPDVQHIKKENIGLIEVMGLAILPGRLAGDVLNASDRRRVEMYMGDVFLEVLKHAGVFKTDDFGFAAFKRFMATVGECFKM